MHQASNLLRSEDRLFFSLHFHIMRCEDQNETGWEQTMIIYVVPLENPFFWVSVSRTKWHPPLPLRSHGLNHTSTKWVAESLSTMPCHLLGTYNLTGTFATGMCDLVTFAISVNASGIESATFWRSIILFTSLSHCEVRGSKWERVGTTHDNSRRSLGIFFFYLPLTTGRLSH